MRLPGGVVNGHSQDSDCTVVNGECAVCGAWHGAADDADAGCSHCDGRAYHKPGCPDPDAWDHREDDRATERSDRPQVSR